MPTTFEQALQKRIIPVVAIHEADNAHPLADALIQGGLPCAEITFRTKAAESVINILAQRADLLVGAGQKADALAVYAECVGADSGFNPSAPALYKLAGWLNETGKARKALNAYSRLTKGHPHDPLVPKAYLRAAQIFHDRLLNPEKAKTILKAVIKKYPDHEAIAQIKAYLNHIGAGAG